MKYLYTKREHYLKFVAENKNNRLSKFLKIMPPGDKMNLFRIANENSTFIKEEIFGTPYFTRYQLINLSPKSLKVLFKSNSDTLYRLDIKIIDEEIGTTNHIAFTEEDSKYDIYPTNQEDFEDFESSYNAPTGKHEMIELMNRMHYILEDLVKKGHITNSFCIGGTDLEEKNNIYEYFLKVVVGKDGFRKEETDIYPSGWGLYFKIDID